MSEKNISLYCPFNALPPPQVLKFVLLTQNKTKRLRRVKKMQNRTFSKSKELRNFVEKQRTVLYEA
jgi:hypothetical protein